MDLPPFIPFLAKRRPQHGYVAQDRIRRAARDSRDDAPVRALADEVHAHGRTLLGDDRLYVIWQAIRNVHRLGLAAAEVGSFRGGSAYFIASAHHALSGMEHDVHIIDTFEGHPTHTDPAKDPIHRPGMFRDTSYEEVRDYLAPWKRLTIHKGDFESASARLATVEYGFVHLDVDIYATTLRGLRYFAERLAPGGVIVIDDYGAPKCPGVDQAVHEFLSKDRACSTWYFGTEQLVVVKALEAGVSAPA